LTNKKKRRRSRTIPILPIIGLAGGVLEPVKRVVSGDWEGGLTELAQRATGVDLTTGTFNPQWLGSFWLPIIVGAGMHKVANWLGINRMFANAPSPLNKLRL